MKIKQIVSKLTKIAAVTTACGFMKGSIILERSARRLVDMIGREVCGDTYLCEECSDKMYGELTEFVQSWGTLKASDALFGTSETANAVVKYLDGEELQFFILPKTGGSQLFMGVRHLDDGRVLVRCSDPEVIQVFRAASKLLDSFDWKPMPISELPISCDADDF